MWVPSEILVLRNICMSNSVEFMMSYMETSMTEECKRAKRRGIERYKAHVGKRTFPFKRGGETAGTLTAPLVSQINKLMLTSIALRKQEEK